MTRARWKDLCIDALDAGTMGEFWGAALGLEVERLDDGDAKLTGPTPEHTVWVNTVREPVTVKQRVHLDLNGRSVDEYERLGATVVSAPGQFAWTVLRDPEGGELCVFVRDAVAEQRLYEIVVDCAEPEPIAHWWAEVFGGRLVHDERGFSWVEQIPDAPFYSMDFIPVPEPKTVKNRIHWDVTGDPDGLVGAGATVLRAPDDEIHWHVLADPDGNEFCCFAG